MQQQPEMNRFLALRGQPVLAADGDKIGNVEEIYYDEATGVPEWIGIGTGFLGRKRLVVPVEGARIQEGEQAAVQVPYSKDQVKDTPEVPADQIPEETERELYRHYGLQPSRERSETQLPGGGAPAPEARGEPPPGHHGFTQGEASMTRSEEELRVGKRPVDRGRARLRKWVETEPASEEVELTEERARVTREPMNEPASGAQIGEQEAEVTLHGEEPVVGKETVAKERVTLEREEETRRETVGDEVRKERVDVEGDVEEEDRGRP
ncbi:MAG TPA: PRC and DUF2382 domain-containing protein [Dehalococcoidia bacterium]